MTGEEEARQATRKARLEKLRAEALEVEAELQLAKEGVEEEGEGQGGRKKGGGRGRGGGGGGRMRDGATDSAATIAGGGGGEIRSEGRVAADDDKVVLWLQMEGHKMQGYKIFKTHLFVTSFEQFALAKGLDIDALTFTFKGDEISKLDQPRYVGMACCGEEGEKDNIVVVTDKKRAAAARAAEAELMKNAAKTVKIVLQWQGGQQEVEMKMRDTFGLLRAKFAEEKKVDASRVRFVFDGEDLGEHDTPETFDMEDEDKVDVFGLT